MTDQALVQALEERTRVQPQRVVRLRGQVVDELQGPLSLGQEVVLAGPMPPNDLLAQANW